ncbi:MAG: hypothetical protein AB7P19_07235 [Nitrospira sp.]
MLSGRESAPYSDVEQDSHKHVAHDVDAGVGDDAVHGHDGVAHGAAMPGALFSTV